MAYFDKDIYADCISGTNIIAGDDFKTIVCTISQVASNMVVKTLGPYGATTVLDNGTGNIYPTKDGWNALNNMRFSDPLYNSIFAMIKKISFSSASTVGDGTTSAMVIANAFLQSVVASELANAEDFNQAKFRNELDTLVEDVIVQLRNKISVPIEAYGERKYGVIKNIATLAANGNATIGSIIERIYQETGNPDIHVQLVDSLQTTYYIENGFKMEARPLMLRSYVNADDSRMIEKDVSVLIFDHNLTYVDHQEILKWAMGLASKSGKLLVILAPHMDDIVAQWLSISIANIQPGGMPSTMFIQIPTTTAYQKKALGDLAVLTHGQIINQSGLSIFNTLWKMAKGEEVHDRDRALIPDSYTSPTDMVTGYMGRIATLEVTNKEIFVRDFELIADPAALAHLRREVDAEYAELKEKATKTTTGALDKDYMDAHRRYIRLVGKTGVIAIGGASSLEQGCDKDAIDDAVFVCKSAWEHGIVSGMCLDTIAVLNYLAGTSAPGSYRAAVADMLKDAFTTAAQAVLDNKCRNTVSFNTFTQLRRTEGSGVADSGKMTNYEIIRLLQRRRYATITEDRRREHPSYGGVLTYDCTRNTFIDFSYDGAIITSVDNDIQILKSVTSVLSLVITSGQFLSTSRLFDRKMTKQQQAEQEEEIYKRRGAAIGKGIIQSLWQCRPVLTTGLRKGVDTIIEQLFTVEEDGNNDNNCEESDTPN